MKKIYFISILIIFAMTLQPAVESKVDVNKGLQQYLLIQQALAGDDFGKTQKPMQQLFMISEGELKELLAEAVKANDIKELRQLFKPISQWFAKLDLKGDYVLAFCPMADKNKGAPWIQKKGDLRNPYFGAAMLQCGSVKKDFSDKK